jgi:hypothetical protein
LHTQGYSETQGRSFYGNLVEAAGALPGVESATLTSQIPLGLEFRESDVVIEGYQPPVDKDKLEIAFNVVGAGYFKTLESDYCRDETLVTGT